MKKSFLIILAAASLMFYCQKQQDENQTDIPAGEVETLQPKTQANDNLMINELDSVKIDSLNALKAKAEEAKKQSEKPKETKPSDKPKEVKEKGKDNTN